MAHLRPVGASEIPEHQWPITAISAFLVNVLVTESSSKRFMGRGHPDPQERLFGIFPKLPKLRPFHESTQIGTT